MTPKPKKHLTFVEALEDRIAPATIINPYTVTFQDTGGDTAVIKFSAPLFKSAKAAGKYLTFQTNDGSTEAFTGNAVGESLISINLEGVTAAQDMNISVRVLPQVGVGPAGAPAVNVGEILAANFNVPNQVSQNIDLGSIYIQGNLGTIWAGDNFSTPGVKSLTVGSMEVALQGQPVSNVLGPIGKLDVLGNFDTTLNVIGYQFGNIGNLTIGGTLTGDGGDANTGQINFTGRIGTATIGNIVGLAQDGTGELNGSFANPSRIGTLHVLGSITGGAGLNSGQVFAETSIGKVIIGGSVTGSAGEDSGEIGHFYYTNTPTPSQQVVASIGTVTIGGNLMGGSAGTAADSTTGAAAISGDSGIIGAGSIKSIMIQGSLIGGTAGTGTSTDGTLDQTADTSGAILANSVKTVVIGGNITGGSGPTSGAVTEQSFFGTYGDIAVGGAIAGGSGANSGSILLYTQSLSSLRIGAGLTGGSGAHSGEVAVGLNLTTLTVPGSITAGTGANSGEVTVGGSMTSLHLGGSLTGGSAANSGEISVGATLGSLYVAGGVAGGSAADAGFVMVGAGLDTLYIGGSVTGGSAANTGVVSTGGGVNSLNLGGSLTGGTTGSTGEILIGGRLFNGLIKGNLAGNTSIDSATAVIGSGYLQADGITTLDILGNVTSGAITGGGMLANSGAIRSGSNIYSLTIGGEVTGTAANPVYITATQGVITSKHPTSDIAIQSASINGNATYLDLLAGYNTDTTLTTMNNGMTTTTPAGAPMGNPVDGSAQIVSVNFGGNLSASNIVAGAEPATSKGPFGTASDTVIPTLAAAGVQSLIASVIVAGAATGDSSTTDSFGIEAVALDKVSVMGMTIPTSGLIPGTPSAVNGSNLFLLEVKPAS